MFTFWIIAAGLTVLALTFVVIPLLKKNVSTTNVERNALNIAIYQERVAELSQENLTPSQFLQAQQELEKTLSQDLEIKPVAQQPPTARWASIVVILLIPIIAVGGYLRLGQPQLIDSKSNIPANSQVTSIEAMTTKLQQRLAENPDNLTDWYMLARTFVALERFSEANEAFIKALALGGDTDPEILLHFTESLGRINEGKLSGLPSLLLEKILQLDPNNQEALWIYGFAAMQSKAYPLAIARWQRLLTQMPEEEVQARQTLLKAIADAEAEQMVQTQTTVDATAEPATVSTTIIENQAKIQVHVSVDPHLQDKIQATDTVFIYAKAVQGPAMPLAAVKKLANELPITVTLDDTMAMMPTMKLSNFSQVSVLARISNSGAAIAESGDLLGQVETVDLEKSSEINIIINQIVP